MEPLTPRDIRARLDELAEIQSAADVKRLDYEAKRAEILKTVQAELEALEAEYAPSIEAVTARIAALEDEIKGAVLRSGATVKGSRLQAVYYHGRVRWDSKGLDSYRKAHPEIDRFCSYGKASVSLRVIKLEGDPDKGHNT